MCGSLAFASCTQPTNGNGGGDKDLVLSASKSEITADGTDKVTFTVKYGEEDVTANASIADAATGEALSGSEFATETAGSYEFVASYDGKESNKVKVDATAVSGLVLSVDKESIVNDGEDTATFTVTFDGNDVTAQAPSSIRRAARHGRRVSIRLSPLPRASMNSKLPTMT
mgnify:CR=1 FL=1